MAKPPRCTKISVAYTNIRSILNKGDDLGGYLDDSQCDVVALTETWLKPDIQDREIFPSSLNFNVYRCDREVQRGGGVLIAIKKSITSFAVALSNRKTEFTSICICHPNGKTIICVCYRPPNSDSNFSDDLHINLTEIKTLYPKADIILFGDFNFPSINWSNLSFTGSGESGSFLDVCHDFNLTQLVDQPTRDANILDLVLTTSPQLIQTITYTDGFSDHKLLHVVLSFPVHAKCPVFKVIRDYSKADTCQLIMR